MATPKYRVTAVEPDLWNKDTGGTKKDRNPSWCVAFVRFKTPGSMVIGNEDPFAERPVLIVENDCVAVSISNTKSSFAKSCNLTMKLGEVFYQNAVAPGDWVFVWLANEQDHIDKIINTLFGNDNGTPGSIGKLALNSWYSGFKFMGRVLDLPFSDSISSNGQRDLTQTINCQAFIELASSIYYTFASQALLNLGQEQEQKSTKINFYETELKRIATNTSSNNPANSSGTQAPSNGLEASLSNLSAAFLNFYKPIATADGKTSTPDSSPEAIIGLMFILTMGIEAQGNQVNGVIPGAQGTFTDAIGIPASVGRILGRTGKKLWQMYNVCLGLQKYEAKDQKKPWVNFSPIYTPESNKKGSVFYRTPTVCKGFIPFMTPPLWDNDSYWNIFNQFLNPICNEMYTALRCNAENRIVPTLIVREKPFSTDLFKYLLGKAPTFTANNAPAGHVESSAVKALKEEYTRSEDERHQALVDYEKLDPDSDIKQRTYFNNLPRWIIDESVLLNISVTPSESRRINFVQVWGRSAGVDFTQANINPERFKVTQFMIPNYVQDTKDIKRHGLRADISETNFDVLTGTFGSISHILCRQRADWLFNGQLKPFGSITLQGVQEPICEGDNVQVRGVLFHIDSVQHSASLSPDGKKQFRTTLTVSNGIIAASLDTGNKIPQYPIGNQNYSRTPDLAVTYNLPGMIDIENTGPRKGRNGDGENITDEGDHET